MVNVAPSPSSLATEMVPPWAATRSLAEDRPSPVLPADLVVKNGVKTRARTSSDIPMPGVRDAQHHPRVLARRCR